MSTKSHIVHWTSLELQRKKLHWLLRYRALAWRKKLHCCCCRCWWRGQKWRLPSRDFYCFCPKGLSISGISSTVVALPKSTAASSIFLAPPFEKSDKMVVIGHMYWFVAVSIAQFLENRGCCRQRLGDNSKSTTSGNFTNFFQCRTGRLTMLFFFAYAWKDLFDLRQRFFLNYAWNNGTVGII